MRRSWMPSLRLRKRNGDSLTGIFCGFLGETALRFAEGLRVRWSHLDMRRRQLTVDGVTKNAKVRHVPLSDYAVELLSQLTRVVNSPFVFTQLETMEILGETFARDRLDDARGKVGLDWVSFTISGISSHAVGDARRRSAEREGAPGTRGHPHHNALRALFARSRGSKRDTAYKAEQQELAVGTEAAGDK
jgi:integrase